MHFIHWPTFDVQRMLSSDALVYETQPEVLTEAQLQSHAHHSSSLFILSFCKLTEHAQLRLIIFICVGT